MNSMLKTAAAKVANRMYDRAMDDNRRAIVNLVADSGSRGTLVDLGCDDGGFTSELAGHGRFDHVVGVEIYDERADLARQRGIDVRSFDLNGSFALDDESVDLVHSNQVFEHLWNTDSFLLECRRILRPGGVLLVSTENAASWCNVAATAFGWQPFSLTNFSVLGAGLGNPLAIHRHEDPAAASWCHVRVLTLRALVEYLETAGFVVRRRVGSGYFPLPSRLGRLDPTHAHFITVLAERV